MTTKETLHQLVDELSEEEAQSVLGYLPTQRETPGGEPAIELLKLGKPIAEDDPLWNLIGIIDDPTLPTDISENLDKYLADAYYDWHRD